MGFNRFTRITPREYQQTIGDYTRFPFQEMYALAKENQNRRDQIDDSLSELEGASIPYGYRTRTVADEVNNELQQRIANLSERFANNPNDLRSIRQGIAETNQWLMNDPRAKISTYDASLKDDVDKNLGHENYGTSMILPSDIRDSQGNWGQIDSKNIPSTYDIRSLYDFKTNPGDAHMNDIYKSVQPSFEQMGYKLVTDEEGNSYYENSDKEKLSREEFDRVVPDYIRNAGDFSNLSPEAAQFIQFNKAMNPQYGVDNYIDHMRRKFNIGSYEKDHTSYSKAGKKGDSGEKAPPPSFTSNAVMTSSSVIEYQPLNKTIAESSNPEEILRKQFTDMGVSDSDYNTMVKDYGPTFYSNPEANNKLVENLAGSFYKKAKESVGQKAVINSEGKVVYDDNDQELKDKSYEDAQNAAAYMKTYMNARREALNESGLAAYYNDKTGLLTIPEDIRKQYIIVDEPSHGVMSDPFKIYKKEFVGNKSKWDRSPVYRTKTQNEIDKEIQDRSIKQMSSGKYQSILDAKLKDAFGSKYATTQQIQLNLGYTTAEKALYNPSHELFAKTASNKVIEGGNMIINGVSYGRAEMMENDIMADLPLATASPNGDKKGDFTGGTFNTTKAEWDSVNNKWYAVGQMVKTIKNDDNTKSDIYSSVIRVDMTDEMMGEGNPFLSGDEQSELLMYDAINDQMRGMVNGERRQFVPGYYSSDNKEHQKVLRETLPTGIVIEKTKNGYKLQGDIYVLDDKGNPVKTNDYDRNKVYSDKEMVTIVPDILAVQSMVMMQKQEVKGEPLDIQEFESSYSNKDYTVDAAKTIGVEPNDLLKYSKSIMDKESSGGKLNQKSSGSNAMGVYQMMPNTIKDVAASLGDTPPTMKEFVNDIDMQHRYAARLLQMNYVGLNKIPKFASMSKADKMGVLAYAHHAGLNATLKYFNFDDPSKSYEITGGDSPTVDSLGGKSIDHYNYVKSQFE